MKQKEEIFKDIKGYEGLYQISNFGNVKSLERDKIYPNGKIQPKKEQFLKPFINGGGYPTVRLCKKSKVKNYTVHRLVATAFIPNPDNLPCVNHKDENKQNNNVENLEWCSVAYNNNYGTRLERVSSSHKGKPHPWQIGRKHSEETRIKMKIARNKRPHPYNRKPIEQYDKEGNFIRTWDYIRQLNDVFGKIVSPAITACCKGRAKTAHGFIWKYKDVS